MNGQMLGAVPAPEGDSYNPGWRNYKKLNDLNNPTPAMAWIF
jgi:hypothetical protein